MNPTNLQKNETGTIALDTLFIIFTALIVGVFGVYNMTGQPTAFSADIWSVILVSSLGTLPFVAIARMIVQRRQE